MTFCHAHWLALNCIWRNWLSCHVIEVLTNQNCSPETRRHWNWLFRTDRKRCYPFIWVSSRTNRPCVFPRPLQFSSTLADWLPYVHCYVLMNFRLQSQCHEIWVMQIMVSSRNLKETNYFLYLSKYYRSLQDYIFFGKAHTYICLHLAKIRSYMLSQFLTQWLPDVFLRPGPFK